MSIRREMKWFMKPSRMAVLVVVTSIILLSTLALQHHQTSAIITQANDYISGQISGITDKFSSQEEEEPIDEFEEDENDKEELNLHLVNDFWTKIFKIFDENRFLEDIKPLIKYVPKAEQAQTDVNSRIKLLSKAHVYNKENVTELHKTVFDALPDKLPETVYKPGTSGIVTIGGDFYSWLAYINIMHIRKLGSQVPVEVIMPSIEDYKREREFCEVLLPKLDAKCLIVPEIMGIKAYKKWEFKSYQFKILAIALSSFQNVLLLDSENMPARDPQILFDLAVFNDHGLVLWPDYWQRTIHPAWYDIVGRPYSTTTKSKSGKFPLKEPIQITPQEELKTKFNDLEGTISDMSTESGQVLINKATHGKVVLMSLYYNLFGPELYYKLFSLGEMGEGDKDTFITSAFVCNKSWYQVHSTIRTFGYHSGGSFHGMVMAQKNPQQDYEKYQENVKEGAESPEDISKWNDLFNKGDVEVFFMHCNIKKINPASYLKDGGICDKEKNRMKVRFYSNFKHHDNDGNEVDFELSRYEIVKQILCLDNTRFRFIKDADFAKVCSFLDNTIEWLKTD